MIEVFSESKKCSKVDKNILVLSCGQTNILHTHTKKEMKGKQLPAMYQKI